MANNSATGGYLPATGSTPLPGSLTLTQFIQTVLVGITGLDGTLVRPEWQIAPPKQPDITVNWLAFGIEINKGDANAYIAPPASASPSATSQLQRIEELEVRLSFYGPDALEYSSILRDGFQIQQNLEALTLALMGFKEMTPARSGADLFNERWYNRYNSSVFLVRQVQRTYSVLSFASAVGTIHTVFGGEERDIDFSAGTPV